MKNEAMEIYFQFCCFNEFIVHTLLLWAMETVNRPFGYIQPWANTGAATHFLSSIGVVYWIPMPLIIFWNDLMSF